jgi:hypothetical protein
MRKYLVVYAPELSFYVYFFYCPRFNHSGKMGAINWLYGVMGIANAQRTLDTIRVIAEFISQPQYSDVVVMFGLVSRLG